MAPSPADEPTPDTTVDLRTNPDRDRRRLALYCGALLIVYLGASFLAWPGDGSEPSDWLFLSSCTPHWSVLC